MSVTTSLGGAPRTDGPGRPAVGRGARRGLLAAHILSAGAWVGVDVVALVLVATGRWSDDPSTRLLAYRALATFVVTPMLVASVVCLATGVLLGLATRWGLVRYWWVAVKLAMTCVLVLLITLLLRPDLAQLRAQGESLAADGGAAVVPATLFFPPAVSLAALTAATLLSVYKPWGRTRRLRRRARALPGA